MSKTKMRVSDLTTRKDVKKTKKRKLSSSKNKTKWKESMKTNEKMMNMTRILAQELMMKDFENSFNAWI